MVNKNLIQRTEEKIKLHINGEDILMDIYKIPLNILHYNKYNDRILDKISSMDISLSEQDMDNAIEDFIWNDDLEANKKTMSSIQSMGQQEYGVVLGNGTVIDGNRRFTCLRMINRGVSSNPAFAYFKAVILGQEYSRNLKAIKSLELQIQHGRESKKGYNPVNQALAMYRDIERDKVFTTLEYAKAIGQTTKNVEKWVGKGRLIEEFLRYINHEQRYDIARLWKLDGPIEDIYNYLKDDDKEEEKSMLFDYLFVNGGQKNWKNIRKLIKSLKANPKKIMEMYAENEGVIEAIHNGLTRKIPIKDIKNNIELSKGGEELFEKLMNLNNHEIIEDDTSKKLQDVTKKLQELDFDLLSMYKNTNFEGDYLDLKKTVKDIYIKLYEQY